MVKCEVCQSELVKEVLTVNSYKVYKCSSCGLIFTFPQPTDKDLLEYYQGFLFNEPKPEETRKQIEVRLDELKKHFAKFLDSDTSNLKFLDYGGGTGAMYKAAKESGFQAFYFDLDQESVSYVKENHQLNKYEHIVNPELEALKYDIIWSDNVIEHVKDPIGFIKNLYQALKPGGVLVIKTPQASNTETLMTFMLFFSYLKTALKDNKLPVSLKSVFRYKYWHCEPPRHLFAFSKKSFVNICNKCRIDINDVQINDYYISWFTYSLLHAFISLPNSIFKFLFGLIILPFILPEFVLITIRSLLSKVGLISGSGLVVKIVKKQMA